MALFQLKLISRRFLAPSVCQYVFVRTDDQPLEFKPGQFVQIHFSYADGTPTKRSYSLATVRELGAPPGRFIEIVVSYVAGGAATALLEGLAPGDTVDASGPFGRFYLLPADANPRYLLIGTGTGVAPYRTMLPQLEKLIRERDLQVVMLFGARSPGELLFGDEFRAFATRYPDNFRFVPCFSRELPAADSPHAHADVRHGYVQQFLGEFHPRPDDIAYICGNPNMVDACVEAMKGYGLPMAQIRRERYISSK